jgi:hypothetical protein
VLGASGYDRRVVSRVLLGAVLGLAACSPSSPSPTALCGDAATATLTVSVVNDTNEPINICNAMVVATGPSTVTLTPSGGASSNSCDYVGTVNAGDYSVTATAMGYQTGTIHQNVQGGCNTTAAIDVIPSP